MEGPWHWPHSRTLMYARKHPSHRFFFKVIRKPLSFGIFNIDDDKSLEILINRTFPHLLLWSCVLASISLIIFILFSFLWRGMLTTGSFFSFHVCFVSSPSEVERTSQFIIRFWSLSIWGFIPLERGNNRYLFILSCLTFYHGVSVIGVGFVMGTMCWLKCYLRSWSLLYHHWRTSMIIQNPSHLLTPHKLPPVSNWC